MILFSIARVFSDQYSRFLNYTGLHIFVADTIHFQYDSTIDCPPTEIQIDTPLLRYNDKNQMYEYTSIEFDRWNIDPMMGLHRMYFNRAFRNSLRPAPIKDTRTLYLPTTLRLSNQIREINKSVIRQDIADEVYDNKNDLITVVKDRKLIGLVEDAVRNHFKTLNTVVGRGLNGPVYAELHRVSKKELALKTLKIGLGRGDCSSDDILLELTIMSPTNAHKNIVLLQNFYIDPLSNKIVLAMDLMSCSLFDFIGRTEGRKLPEEHTLFVFNEIIEGLMHLRGCLGLFHNDMKPGNILISAEGEVKVADFGMAKKIKEKYITPNGTTRYMAPEVADLNKNYGDKSDIWSLGLVLIDMLDGLPCIFPSECGDKYLNRIAKTSTSPYSKVLSEGNYLNRLIQKLLEIDPAKRISLEDLSLYFKLSAGYNFFRMSTPQEFREYFKKQPKTVIC